MGLIWAEGRDGVTQAHDSESLGAKSDQVSVSRIPDITENSRQLRIKISKFIAPLIWKF